MRLRTHILLFLMVLGLAPVAAVISLNLPMVLANLELWVQRAHLQNLRLEFGDLHRYLASREEMVRFLAKLPPPPPSSQEADGERSGDYYPGNTELPFSEWINHTLRSGPEIYQVLYLDRNGREYYRLERAQAGAPLLPAPAEPQSDHRKYFDIASSMQRDGVFFSPLEFTGPDSPSGHSMVIRMASPLFGRDERPLGVVMVNIDAGGLAYAYPNNLWALNDGRYLANPLAHNSTTANALKDFPGLADAMAEPRVTILRGPGDSQVIWMPLFPTEAGGSLWVGKQVDATDMDEFRGMLIRQMVMIGLVLIIVVLLLGRWIALRMERFGDQLKDGVQRILNNESGVVFSWRGPREMQELAGELTRLADTHAMNTQKLIARAHELEASNRYKSEFLANMSHELRTPLNSIILLSKILGSNDSGNLSEEQVKQARVINAAGNDLATLINDILDLSKIEARRTTLYLREVDPAQLCHGLAEMLEPQVRSRGLELHWSVDQDVPEQLVTDEDKLRQILKNFLSNAVKFTEHGTINLTIARNTAEDAGERPLAIRVTDSGIGIPQDQLDAVFEPFRQVDGSTKRRHGGTGLGLAISNELAKLLGGRITLESTPGHGSTFTLLLPRELDTSTLDSDRYTYAREGEPESAPEPEAAPAGPTLVPMAPAPAAAAPPPPASLAERRVLLVDDDLDHLLQLTPMLVGLGVEVTAAESLDEALHTLNSDAPFDAVLLDLHLCELDEAATVDCLLAAQRGSGALPVLVLRENPAADLSATGVEAVLDLPTSPAALEQALLALLNPESSVSPTTGTAP